MKCLVVSDIEASRDEKVQFLHDLNLFSSVGIATTAEQAVVKLKKFSYGIVILDLDAPEANMNLLKQIRGEKIFVCVIMLSAQNSVEYVSEAFSYGVSDYIIKPGTCKRFGEAAMRAVSKRECLLQFKFMTQDEVDHCISLNVLIAPSTSCRKGISNETYSFVHGVIADETEGFTAADIAKKTGISSITVRKYLNRMYESGLLKTELDYGEIGRPQKLYYHIKTQKED